MQSGVAELDAERQLSIVLAVTCAVKLRPLHIGSVLNVQVKTLSPGLKHESRIAGASEMRNICTVGSVKTGDRRAMLTANTNRLSNWPIDNWLFLALKHECDVAEPNQNALTIRRRGLFMRKQKQTRDPNQMSRTLIALIAKNSVGEIIEVETLSPLPSRSLNIPRPPRVDGGGLPLCGMPLTNVAVLQRELDGQQGKVKAAA